MAAVTCAVHVHAHDAGTRVCNYVTGIVNQNLCKFCLERQQGVVQINSPRGGSWATLLAPLDITCTTDSSTLPGPLTRKTVYSGTLETSSHAGQPQGSVGPAYRRICDTD